MLNKMIIFQNLPEVYCTIPKLWLFPKFLSTCGIRKFIFSCTKNFHYYICSTQLLFSKQYTIYKNYKWSCFSLLQIEDRYWNKLYRFVAQNFLFNIKKLATLNFQFCIDMQTQQCNIFSVWPSRNFALMKKMSPRKKTRLVLLSLWQRKKNCYPNMLGLLQPVNPRTSRVRLGQTNNHNTADEKDV